MMTLDEAMTCADNMRITIDAEGFACTEDFALVCLAAEVRRLQAENDRLKSNPPQSLSPWQPIATAPKDGSAVILRNEHGGVIVALFRDVYPSGFRPNSPWQSLMLNHNYLPSAMRFGAPTHWMPLPEPAP